MDALRGFLDDLKRQGLDRGHTRGVLHLLVGRRVRKADGTLVSPGLTWRAAAQALKRARWPKESVRELGLNPSELPPRDRLQFWYAAISRAALDSAESHQAGEALAALLAARGYRVE
jgi:hypothetical protein